MRRRYPVRIGEVLGDFFTTNPTVARKLAEARLDELWPQLVGTPIAAYTTALEVKNGKLTARISSSVARNEVFMRREAIRQAINEASGMELIKVFIVK